MGICYRLRPVCRAMDACPYFCYRAHARCTSHLEVVVVVEEEEEEEEEEEDELIVVTLIMVLCLAELYPRI